MKESMNINAQSVMRCIQKMNDFTKEELENLLACVNSNRAFHINHMELIYPQLKNKLQSMIDNYCDPCEHELHSRRDEIPLAKTICCDEELTYTNTVWSSPKCHKCGRVLNDNQ